MIYLDYVPKTEYMIYQDRSKFSYGLDSIILSSFSKMREKSKLIDIGSGNGILSLRANSMYDLKEVVSVEIQKEISDIYKETLKYNGIENITLINDDINNVYKNYKSGYFDYVITNPPYMKMGEGVDNLDENSMISRMEKYLKIEDIFKISLYLLRDKGKLFMINRPRRTNEAIVLGDKYNMRAKRIRLVQSSIDKKPNLVLFEFMKNGGDNLVFEKNLIVNVNGEYSKEILDIYGRI